jgi:GxxExxY protein
MDLLYKRESYDLIGAFFEVRNELGPGFLEEVYQQALTHETVLRRIPFLAKPKLEIRYKGELLKQAYEPDFTGLSVQNLN